ncbi:hypothetical protein DFH09DRAFT_1458356 [Mycena vulgaris]|nr:hypothetical protein DFH09DRAFT_1458356 [Mycena vulgaris]
MDLILHQSSNTVLCRADADANISSSRRSPGIPSLSPRAHSPKDANAAPTAGARHEAVLVRTAPHGVYAEETACTIAASARDPYTIPTARSTSPLATGARSHAANAARLHSAAYTHPHTSCSLAVAPPRVRARKYGLQSTPSPHAQHPPPHHPQSQSVRASAPRRTSHESALVKTAWHPHPQHLRLRNAVTAAAQHAPPLPPGTPASTARALHACASLILLARAPRFASVRAVLHGPTSRAASHPHSRESVRSRARA